ncbi:MAG: hypothetical protein V3W41_19115 [Planctomycetota bacterium]
MSSEENMSSLELKKYTLDNVGEQCCAARSEAVEFFQSDGVPNMQFLPPIYARGPVEELSKHARQRLRVRNFLSRLLSIGIGVDHGLYDIEMIAVMEGSSITNMVVRWAEFIALRREQQGFATSYDSLLRLVTSICEHRIQKEENGRDKDYWDEVKMWAADPDNTDALLKLREFMSDLKEYKADA